MSDKPVKAADRTIGIFDGKTDKEKADEAERIRLNADLGEQTHEGPAETIMEATNRWRNIAFQGQEWATKHFNDPEAKRNQYRLSEDKGWCYIEIQRVAFGITGKPGGGAYHYAGIMFPSEDLEAIASVLVGAIRAKRARKSDG